MATLYRTAYSVSFRTRKYPCHSVTMGKNTKKLNRGRKRGFLVSGAGSDTDVCGRLMGGDKMIESRVITALFRVITTIVLKITT